MYALVITQASASHHPRERRVRDPCLIVKELALDESEHQRRLPCAHVPQQHELGLLDGPGVAHHPPLPFRTHAERAELCLPSSCFVIYFLTPLLVLTAAGKPSEASHNSE